MGVVVLFVILGIGTPLLYWLVQWIAREPCDLCGSRAHCDPLKGFKLCKRCTHVAETSSLPIGDLIAQGLANKASQESAARLARSITNINNLAVVVVVAIAAWMVPGSVWQSLIPKTPLPITVDARESAVVRGTVLQLANQKEQEITVRVDLQGNGRPKQDAVPIKISPNGAVEIGWAEGFDFKIGDRVVFTHPLHHELVYILK